MPLLDWQVLYYAGGLAMPAAGGLIHSLVHHDRRGVVCCAVLSCMVTAHVVSTAPWHVCNTRPCWREWCMGMCSCALSPCACVRACVHVRVCMCVRVQGSAPVHMSVNHSRWPTYLVLLCANYCARSPGRMRTHACVGYSQVSSLMQHSVHMCICVDVCGMA